MGISWSKTSTNSGRFVQTLGAHKKDLFKRLAEGVQRIQNSLLVLHSTPLEFGGKSKTKAIAKKFGETASRPHYPQKQTRAAQ